MDVDVALGALIGIAGTLLGSLLTYYLGIRREDRTRRIRDWNKVRDEVYSPLIFGLQSIRDWGTLQNLRVMSKTIPALLEKYTKEQVATCLTYILKFANYDQSQMLEDVLRKKTRLIRPQALWFDLAVFCDNLKHIEKTLAIMSTGFLEKSPDELIAAIRNMAQIGTIMDEAARQLMIDIGKIALMDKPPKFLDYQPFFNESVRKDIVKELDKFPIFLPDIDRGQQRPPS